MPGKQNPWRSQRASGSETGAGLPRDYSEIDLKLEKN